MIITPIVIEYDEPTQLLHTIEVELSDDGESAIIFQDVDELDRRSREHMQIPLAHVRAVAEAMVAVAKGAGW